MATKNNEKMNRFNLYSLLPISLNSVITTLSYGRLNTKIIKYKKQ